MSNFCVISLITKEYEISVILSLYIALTTEAIQQHSKLNWICSQSKSCLVNYKYFKNLLLSENKRGCAGYALLDPRLKTACVLCRTSNVTWPQVLVTSPQLTVMQWKRAMTSHTDINRKIQAYTCLTAESDLARRLVTSVIQTLKLCAISVYKQLHTSTPRYLLI